MPTPQKRQSETGNKSIKAQDQVVDITPLNSIEQTKTSSKEKSSSNKNSSNTSKISTPKNSSNFSGGGGSSEYPIGRNKDFERYSNFL